MNDESTRIFCPDFMGGARGDGVASSIQSFEILPIILRKLKFSVAHVSLVQHPLRASLARECWHSRDVGLLQTSRASATKGVLSVEFAFLYADLLGKPTWMWLAFLGIVIALLTFDLGVLHKKTREIEVKESLILSVVYITLGLAFGVWVWWYLGAELGMAHMTTFVVEKMLGIDNVFVIAIIFSFIAVPRPYQHRVLFWGILGVIVLRAIMIGLGATLVAQFGWVLYILAAFLIATGVKMLVLADKEYSIANNPIVAFMRKHFNVTNKPHGEKFFVQKPHPASGKAVWFMTPPFMALVLIEVADVIFAVDSVPAIFALTTDPFIVYTSNIFAILGLRALYFVLAAMITRFTYLKTALAVVLISIGSKIFIADLLGIVKFPPAVSLSITFAILAFGVVYSLWKMRG